MLDRGIVHKVRFLLGIHDGIAGIRTGLDLQIREDLLHFQRRAGDGNVSAFHGDGVHLDHQDLILTVGIPDDVPLLQAGECLVRIRDHKNTIFIIRCDYSVLALYNSRPDHRLVKHAEVGGIVVVKIPHQRRIIVVHRGVQQFLHTLGVHIGLVLPAQRFQGIHIQQIRACQEIFRHLSFDGDGSFRAIRVDGGLSAGEHLQAVLRVDRHHQSSRFPGGIAHRGGAALDGKLRHGESAGVFRCGHCRLVIHDLLAEQCAKAVGARCRYGAVVHGRQVFLRRLGLGRQHRHGHADRQQECQKSFKTHKDPPLQETSSSEDMIPNFDGFVKEISSVIFVYSPSGGAVKN